MINKTKKNARKAVKILLTVAIVLLAVGGFLSFKFYRTFFAPNITANEKYLYIKTGFTYDNLIAELKSKKIFNDLKTFKEAAEKMNLKTKLKPGRYLLKKDMSNRAFINMLKTGNQQPVKLKFQNIRKIENFAAYLSKNLETDSLTFIKYLGSATFAQKYGFNTETFYTMFIPNTYELYWNINATDFLKLMNKEYHTFWNEHRLAKTKELGLSPVEVSILASIVDSEALYDSEMKTIAGLYLNRLKKGILLQADPTVIFANNDFFVRRVTSKLLNSTSRYNTYKYPGLPPGPITMPSINAIDAVLNHDNNNYLYMCAKEDFSGYHNFAATKEEHEKNAKKYRYQLNKRNIYR